jgi:hypothetical protein
MDSRATPHTTSLRRRDFRGVIVAELVKGLSGQRSIPDTAREMTRVGQLILDKIPA